MAYPAGIMIFPVVVVVVVVVVVDDDLSHIQLFSALEQAHWALND